MTEVGASWGNRGAPFSFCPEGRTYSPPGRRPGGGTAALRQARALRGGLRSLRRAPDNTAVSASSGRHCLRGGSGTPLPPPAKNCTRQLYRRGGAKQKCSPRFLFCERETEKGNTEVKATGDIPLGSEGHQQRRGSICLRSIGLYELFRHL